MRRLAAAFIVAFALCFGTAAADDTYATTTLTVQQVFAKAREARGHLLPGAYRSVMQTVDGGVTRTAETVQHGHDFRTVERSPLYTLESGSYDGQHWRRDANGTVIRESGLTSRNNPYAMLEARLGSEANPPGARVLGITNGNPAYVVVQLQPDSGLRELRYYDAKTFLPARVQATNYRGDTYEYSYSDYQRYYGFLIPRTTTYSDEHSENTMKATLLSFTAIPSAGLDLAVPQSTPLFDLGGRASAAIPASFTRSGIVVRVSINGRGLDFELDSGASPIVLDAQVARELGLAPSGSWKQHFGGTISLANGRVPELDLGDLRAHNVAIEIIPFSRRVGERRVVGLLGGDFFASGRIAVNFQHQTVTLQAPSTAPPPAPWDAIPIDVDSLVPMMQAKFNGVKGTFIVDLGAFETMLYPHFFKTFHPDRKGDVMGEVVGVAGSPSDFHRYTFSRFDFGDLAFADASAIVASGRGWEDLDYDGLIGRNVLSNFNIIFDYPNRKMYVQSLVQ